MLLASSIGMTFGMWTQYHNLLYSQGKRKHPFFSNGSNRGVRIKPIAVKGRYLSASEHEQYLKTAVLAGLIMTSLFLSIGLGQMGYSHSGQGTGQGRIDERNLANFPPPSTYQQINSTSAYITLINAARDDLTLRLRNPSGSEVNLRVEGCETCRSYGPYETPECGSIGEWKSFTIPPGQYEVLGLFHGAERIKGFRSAWLIASGWEYRQCLYQSTDRSY